MEGVEVVAASPEKLRGVAFEVVNVKQAKIAESAGACAVVVSELAGDHRSEYPSVTKKIKAAVSIPVVAKCRVGHEVEARILDAIGVDYIDENEALPAANREDPILSARSWRPRQHSLLTANFRTSFVGGCRNCIEAGRMAERHGGGSSAGLIVRNKLDLQCPDGSSSYENIVQNASALVGGGRPHGVPVFAAGKGIETPADAALLMRMGCDGVFVGPEIFRDPKKRRKRVRDMVQAVRYYDHPDVLASLG